MSNLTKEKICRTIPSRTFTLNYPSLFPEYNMADTKEPVVRENSTAPCSCCGSSTGAPLVEFSSETRICEECTELCQAIFDQYRILKNREWQKGEK